MKGVDSLNCLEDSGESLIFFINKISRGLHILSENVFGTSSAESLLNLGNSLHFPLESLGLWAT